MPIWLDAPSIEVIESPNFYHTDAETLNIVPQMASSRSRARLPN